MSKSNQQPYTAGLFAPVEVSFPSVVNSKDFSISPDGWVVSLLRKPEGRNPEHGFIMVEGMNSTGQIVLRRYDFVIDESKERQGQVVIKEETVERKAATAVFQKVFLRNDSVHAMCWDITPAEAKQLHDSVLESRTHPPQYFISGDRAVSGMSAYSTRNPGHNCFTWAREQLRGVTDRIQIPDKMGDFIAARTSVYVTGEKEPGTSCKIL
jgi:hypothetical protein